MCLRAFPPLRAAASKRYTCVSHRRQGQLPHSLAPSQSIQEVSSCLIENTVNMDTRIAISAAKASRSNPRARAEI